MPATFAINRKTMFGLLAAGHVEGLLETRLRRLLAFAFCPLPFAL